MYVFFDLETTGLSISKDEPIQLCAIAFNRNMEFLDKLFYYVYREEPIPEEAVKIHGITNKILVEKGIPVTQAVSQWQNFLRKHAPVHLLGYNVLSFDYPMLMNWVDRHDDQRFKFPPICQITDVLHMVRIPLKTNKWPKLAAAATQLGIQFEQATLHDAEADVRLTAEIWKKIRPEAQTKIQSAVTK